MKKPKESHKTKPKSIRLNKEFLAIALELSGRQTVQGLIDYLLQKYVSDNQKCLFAPIDTIDKRPIDTRIFDVDEPKIIPSEKIVQQNFTDFLKPRISQSELEKRTKTFLKQQEKTFHVPYKETSENSYDGSSVNINSIDEMPTWKPKPKTELPPKSNPLDDSEFVKSEIKRLKEIQERAEKLKGKKK